jgi:transposase
MSQDDLKLPDDVQQLKAMIAQRETAHDIALAERDTALAGRDAMIERQVATIERQDTTMAGHVETIEKQLKKLAGLEQQLARLLRKQYGPQKERIDPDQLTLFSSEELTKLAEELQQGRVDSVSTDDGSETEGTETAEEETSQTNVEPRRKSHGRRPLPDHLPREEVIHELSDDERACPCCGELRCEIAHEASEQLEYVPASLKVVRHLRTKYACKGCEEHVAIAAKPAQPIEKGLAGPGLIAHTILSKYGDYLPLYRQEDILSRSGILIRRSTLCDWVASAADLLKPVYDLMCDRVRLSHVIHTDDTGIKMLQTGKCANCKFWTYVGDDKNPFAVYEFSLTREGKNPSRFLEGFQGYLQADAFSGYDELYATGQVIEVACMAHCRRYWWEAKDTDVRRGHEALSFITQLYSLEDEFDKLQLRGDSLRDARQQHSLPILNAFETWLRKEQPSVLPKSEIGKAFTYTLNQWTALCRYTEDGALDIDNNSAERQVKLPAIGRKNWLFVGSESGGNRAAILLSLIASAKLCGVEPWAWLQAVLQELPLRQARGTPAGGVPDGGTLDGDRVQIELTDLLPDAWLKSHPEHLWKIDDIRQKERQQNRQKKINKRQDR